MNKNVSHEGTKARRNELLEEHFDTAFAAPDGIKKLRELILTLAMQGKLVEQDPNDPPASELLKEIEAEKKRGSHEGTKTRRKKKKKLPPIKPEEVPYELPEGWEWVKLGEFLQMINGRAFKPTDWISEGLPIVRIQNLNNPNAPFNCCDESDVKEQHIIQNGDFLISWSGTPGTSFGAFIWRGNKAALNQHIFKCFQVGNPCTDNFLRLSINNRLDFLISKAQGAVGLKHVTKGTLENMLLPLPPLPEQQRIVERIDQLMARCDALERLRKEREEKRLAVHAAAIKKLLDPSSSNLRAFVPSCETNSPFAFLAQHFGELYTVKENVAELRKAILQLAVMGRLVEQNPSDPPASELLKEIEAEKERVSHEGTKTRRRKEKKLPPIKPEEIPYELPQGWEWTRLGELLVFGPKNGYSPASVNYETPVCSLTLSATTSGTFKGEHSKYIDEQIESDSHLWLKRGDILVQRGNTIEYVGVSAVYHGEDNTYIYPDLMMKLRVASSLSVEYAHIMMSADYSRNFMRAHASGTSGTMPKINQAVVNNVPFALPPLSEQFRIVAKVEHLLTLCDSLDQQIDAATDKQNELLNAVMSAV